MDTNISDPAKTSVHVCMRCGCEFKRERNLLHHFERKRVCVPHIADVGYDVLKYEHSQKKISKSLRASPQHPLHPAHDDHALDTIMSAMDDIRRHMHSETSAIRASIEGMVEMFKCQSAEIKTLRDRVNSLQSFVKQHDSGSTTEHSEEECAIVKNECHKFDEHPFQPSATFGHEWISHLSDTPEALRCFAMRDIVGFVEHVYFDPAHPENATVRSDNDGNVVIWTGDPPSWQISDINEVVDTMIGSVAEFLRRQGQKRKNAGKLENLKPKPPYAIEDTICFLQNVEIGFDNSIWASYAIEVKKLFGKSDEADCTDTDMESEFDLT